MATVAQRRRRRQRLRRLTGHLRPSPNGVASPTPDELLLAWLEFANTLPVPSDSALPRFQADDTQAILAQFAQTGTAVVDGALSTAELRELNDFCDASQRDGRWSAAGEYPQPLLDGEAVDAFVRHPATFAAIEAALGGAGCSRFGQFEFRDIPRAAPPMRMGVHRDRPDSVNLADPFGGGVSGFGTSPVDGTLHYSGEPQRRLDSPSAPLTDYLCAVTYLTDVSPSTPAFCLVPNSFRVPISALRGRDQTRAAHEVAALMAETHDGYTPLPVYGKAGTMILYDVATFHTRADPMDAEGNPTTGERRRSLHRYFGRAVRTTRLCALHLIYIATC
jgi:hypothetical protein